MKTLKLLVICSTLALASTFALGQERKITEDTYWAALRTADSFQWNTPVRITQEDEDYEKGLVTEKGERITERLPPDRLRVVERTEKSGKVETKESIDVARKFYCKEKRAWRRSDNSCAPSTVSGFSSDALTHFYLLETSLEGQSVSVYRLTIEEKPVREGWPDLIEYQTWVDSKGRMIRADRTGFIKSTKQKTFYRTEVFEYNPKGVKIAAPIK